MWKNICYKDIKDIYEVNEFGVIRNRNTLKVIKPFLGNNGYMQIKLARNEKTAPLTVHSIVAYTFLDYDKNISRPEVNHIIGGKEGRLNNSVDNLEIISREENLKHAIKHKLHETLEDRYNASLSNDEVHEICSMLESGVPYPTIRKTIGPKLTNDVLKKIKSGDNYREISKGYNMENATPFKYSDKLRKDIRGVIELGITNVNDVLLAVGLEKNKSTIQLVKHQRARVKKGSTTIEKEYEIIFTE